MVNRPKDRQNERGMERKKGERESERESKKKASLACLALAIDDKPLLFFRNRDYFE